MAAMFSRRACPPLAAFAGIGPHHGLNLDRITGSTGSAA